MEDCAYKNRDWLYRKYWTEGLNQRQIAELCGVTPPTICNYVKRFGIRTHGRSDRPKAASYRRHNGFKRGNIPKTKASIGTIRIRLADAEGKKIRWIKTGEPDIWMRLSRYLWEQETGRKIPKGFIVVHDDRNSLNDDLKNLSCIPNCLLFKWIRGDIKKFNQNRLKKHQEYYQKRKEAEIRMKGKITPRKIIAYVVDITCVCGEKATYDAYEPNRRKLLKTLPTHWNGWQLLPAVRCGECRQKEKETGKEKESFGIVMTAGG